MNWGLFKKYPKRMMILNWQIWRWSPHYKCESNAFVSGWKCTIFIYIEEKVLRSRHTCLAVENIHSSISQWFSISSSWPAPLKTHVFKKKYRPFDSPLNDKCTISTAKWNKCLIKFQPALLSFCIVLKHLGDIDIYHFTFVEKKTFVKSMSYCLSTGYQWSSIARICI